MTTRFEAYVEAIVDLVEWPAGMTPAEIAGEREAMTKRVRVDAEQFLPAPVLRRWTTETVDN